MVFIGCGFLGEAAANLFLAHGWRVEGICRSEASAERLRQRGLEIFATDVSQPGALATIKKHPALVVHCLSTRGGEVGDYRALYRDGLHTVLQELSPVRTIFMSSTSVYGQSDGGWVDETCPAEPPTETSRVLREAEQVALEADGVVLRLAGLYGPGRSIFLKKFLSGEARRTQTRWVNQVHREDAAAAVYQAALLPSGIYNVSDDTPATPEKIYRWIAETLRKPLPPEGHEPASRRRGGSNKRVSNAKLREAGWSPNYPSYRDALPSLIAALPPETEEKCGTQEIRQ